MCLELLSWTARCAEVERPCSRGSRAGGRTRSAASSALSRNAEGNRLLRPALEQSVGRDRLHLLSVAAVGERQHRIMGLVVRAAEPVRDDDDTVAVVDGPQYSAQNTHVCLAARDHERVDPA